MAAPSLGRRQDLQTIFDFLSRVGPEVGLHPNARKSLVWCGDAPLDRGDPRASPSGYHLLGAPVGGIPFLRDTVGDRVAKIAEIFDLLFSLSLNNTQNEFALLRHCFSLPK